MVSAVARPWLLLLLMAAVAVCYLQPASLWSTPSARAPATGDSTRRGSSSSSSNEVTARRLKQLKAEGKSYTLHVEESVRSREAEIRQRVVQYKEKIASAAPRVGCEVIFLPDCSVDEGGRSFYKELMKQLSIEMKEMPNVQEQNTKRYEHQWMTYMRQLGLSNTDEGGSSSSNSSKSAARRVLLAHGTSSEAVLRYLETDPLLAFSAVVLVDASDTYTAGERHGRAFQYCRITANARKIRLVALSTRTLNEAMSIVASASALGYNADDSITVVNAALGDPPTDSERLDAIRRAVYI